MNHEHEWDFDQTLADTELVLSSAAKSAVDDDEYSLDSILAEFSERDRDASPRPKPAGESVERKPLPDLTESDEDASEAPTGETDGEISENSSDDAADDPALAEMFGPAPRAVRLQDVLEQTVRSVLDEEQPAELLPEKPRRGLFSRKKMQETEALFFSEPAPPPAEEEEDASITDFLSDEAEPPIEETVADYRESALETKKCARAAAVVTALMAIPAILESFDLMPALYFEEPLFHCVPYAIALALLCILGRDVFVYGFEQLARRRVTFELLSSLVCLAALADTLLCYFLPERALSAAQPFHTVAALEMTAALFGRAFLFVGFHDTFRVAAVADAPYLVTTTGLGAAKRRGSDKGFAACTHRDDCSAVWQDAILPVLLVAALVFSGLTTANQDTFALLGWNLSVLLAGANALSFPFTYALPFYRLSRRFVKSGSALAGYRAALRLSASNCVILTDTDLFPPGTLSLSGLRIYGEESGKVISYAATMARASESGLSRLFDQLLQSEGALPQKLDNLSFYEEGGCSGLIHGESVLFGTAAFCRKMGVLLPAGLNLKTGVYLAVDRTLIAVFSVKYSAAENVDWALHALRRNHITPVLAVRDGNITPALLKRKFATDARAVFPAIAKRLALSEPSGEGPYALLYREGLMPYAEIAIGSKRLVRAVRLGTALSLASAVVSLLLSFYLAFIGAYNLLAPLTMLIYLLLWAFAALSSGALADRY